MSAPAQIGLFEGFGGLTRAVTKILGAELVAYSEIEEAACRVQEHHNPDVPNLGDITQIDWSQVKRDFKRYLIVTGGFPCTDVSPAGRREGLRPGTRSGLWHHMAYAIDQLRPDLVVIENVRGLLSARGAEPTEELLAAWTARDKASRVLALIEAKLRRAQRERNMPYVHRHQRDRARFLGRRRQAVAAAKRADALIVRAIGTVLGDLADLGYDAQWCGLPASGVGAPHARFRIIIIAWPATGHASLRGRHGGPAAGGRDQREGAARGSGVAVADPDGVGSARSGATRGRRAGSPDHDLAAADACRDGREGRQERDLGPKVGQPTSLGGDAPRRVLDWGDYEPAIRRWELILDRPAPAPTQTGLRGGQQLSPLFVEWMMGLPEGWVTGVPGLSRAEQLKMLGNGVVPQQAEAALLHMLAADVTERAA